MWRCRSIHQSGLSDCSLDLAPPSGFYLLATPLAPSVDHPQPMRHPHLLIASPIPPPIDWFLPLVMATSTPRHPHPNSAPPSSSLGAAVVPSSPHHGTRLPLCSSIAARRCGSAPAVSHLPPLHHARPPLSPSSRPTARGRPGQCARVDRATTRPVEEETYRLI
jgi:hypothetical protein